MADCVLMVQVESLATAIQASEQQKAQAAA